MIIQVIPKPDSISWDVIHNILYNAHEQNRRNGVNMRTALLSGEELSKRVGDGKCFIAIADGVPIGTASAKIVERHQWYHRGRLADFMLLGILPEYGGHGIFSKLLNEIYQFARDNNVNVIEMDTAEGNMKMRGIAERVGFQYVGVKASPYVSHYSMVMVKWLDGCPYRQGYMRFRHAIGSALYKLRFKRGRIRRFGI